MPQFTLSDDVRLHYETAGQGPVIIFLPGLFCSTRFFQAQLAGLRDRFQVIALDYRGHGRSDRPDSGHTVAGYARDLREFCRGLGLGRPVVAGWSLGMLVAWEYVRQFGNDDFAGLINIDQPASDYLWPDWPHGMFDFKALTEIVALLQSNQAGFAAGMVNGIFKTPRPEAAAAWMRAEVLRVPAAVASTIFFDQTVQDYRPVLAGVSLPTLLCFSAAPDRAAGGRHLAAALPDARLELFTDSGHSPHIEEAALFNETVRAFCRVVFAGNSGGV